MLSKQAVDDPSQTSLKEGVLTGLCLIISRLGAFGLSGTLGLFAPPHPAY